MFRRQWQAEFVKHQVRRSVAMKFTTINGRNSIVVQLLDGSRPVDNPKCSVCGDEIDASAAYAARSAKCGGCGTEYFPEG